METAGRLPVEDLPSTPGHLWYIMVMVILISCILGLGWLLATPRAVASRRRRRRHYVRFSRTRGNRPTPLTYYPREGKLGNFPNLQPYEFAKEEGCTLPCACKHQINHPALRHDACWVPPVFSPPPGFRSHAHGLFEDDPYIQYLRDRLAMFCHWHPPVLLHDPRALGQRWSYDSDPFAHIPTPELVHCRDRWRYIDARSVLVASGLHPHPGPPSSVRNSIRGRLINGRGGGRLKPDMFAGFDVDFLGITELELVEYSKQDFRDVLGAAERQVHFGQSVNFTK